MVLLELIIETLLCQHSQTKLPIDSKCQLVCSVLFLSGVLVFILFTKYYLLNSVFNHSFSSVVYNVSKSALFSSVELA